MDKLYTIADIATTFEVSERTVQRWVENLNIKKGNKTLIPEDVYNLLKSRHVHDKSMTNFNIKNDELVNEIKKEISAGNVVETFTPEKYAALENTLKDYAVKCNEINELETKIKYLDKEIVGLVQDKYFLQSQLDKSRDALTQNQWVLAKLVNEKNK